MIVALCLLLVVCCLSCVVSCWLMFDGFNCSLFSVCCLVVVRVFVMCDDRCALIAAWFLCIAVRCDCLLWHACRVLVATCCLLCVVRCL